MTQLNVIRSEWTKLWSLRSTRWSLLASFIAMAGLGPLVAAVQMSRWSQLQPHDRLTYDAINTGVGGYHLAQLAIGVLGVLVISGEYTTGMIRSSMMAVPKRLPVLWAKTGVYAAVTFVLMLIASLISFFVVQAIVTQHHVQHGIGDPGALRTVVGAALFMTVLAVLCIGLGGILRNTAGRNRHVRGAAVRAARDQRDPPHQRQRLHLAVPAAERRHDDRVAQLRQPAPSVGVGRLCAVLRIRRDGDDRRLDQPDAPRRLTPGPPTAARRPATVTHVPTSSLRGAPPRRRRPPVAAHSWLDGGLALVVLAIAVVHTPAGVLGVTLNCLPGRAAAVASPGSGDRVLGGVGGGGSPGTDGQADVRRRRAAGRLLHDRLRRRPAHHGPRRYRAGARGHPRRLKDGAGAEAWLKAFVGLSGLATAAGVLGINVRNRRQILAGLHERAERLEREHEREVALARATERGRIARDMHDVIAHNLSVMVALCDGAGYHVHDAPERVQAALEQASRSGRQALAEMRQLLGVLRRRARGDPSWRRQPGIRQIEELVEQVRGAGIPVSYTLTGKPDGAPPGMELAIYRIVQEALTNTLKHAGDGASAEVSLSCHRATRSRCEISDTGNARRANGSGGAGLRGMTERAAVYGGTLQAGPRPDGGWRVSASLDHSGGRRTGGAR